MTCSECQEWLQRRLDGEIQPCPSALEHLADCPACQAFHASGERLLMGLKAWPIPTLPSDFSRRLTALVLEDRRMRRRRVRVRLQMTMALAASLLLMVLGGYFLLPFPKSGSEQAQGLASAAKGSPPTSTRLDQAAGQALEAVAALSGNWTNKAVEESKSLLSAARAVELPEVEIFPNVSATLEPAAQSLQQAGQDVVAGLEPMAASARRALKYFVDGLQALDGQP